MSFAAGQYLTVVHPGGTAIPFSIASPPEWLPRIQLHYKPTSGHPHSVLMAELEDAPELEIELPFGDVRVDSGSAQPLLLLCEETGFSQAASVIRHFAARRSGRVVRVGWSSPSADFYLADELAGYVPDAVLTVDPDLGARLTDLLVGGEEVILSGSPSWVYHHHDALLAHGVAASDIHSDVFSYAPRGPSPPALR